MSPIEIVAILALTGYALYRQTRTTEVGRHGRFNLALIYGAVGLAVGGFAMPHGATAVTLLAISIVLSVVVGVARGLLTPIWRDERGQVVRRGTAVTVALFLGLIVAKFGLGAFAYLEHVPGNAGFGEVMVMIAVMVAVQAEIVWRRARGRVQSLEGTAPSDERTPEHSAR
ncbi:MAG TPA: hypothetical protein VNP92_13675 [Actinophytocola sp.]|nr:hypothetical protein [Actinophytocola sp.]